MSKFKPINGYTKQKILDVIEARPSTKAALNDYGACVYLTSDGNKCAVGLFIPDGHSGQSERVSVKNLLIKYSDLKTKMPLPIDGMGQLQRLHDEIGLSLFKDETNVKQAIIDWVEENVQ